MARTRYEANSGDIHQIYMSAPRISAAGAAPAGSVSNDIIVKVSKKNREYGLRPRGVILTRTVGTAPNAFNKRTFLPVLTPTAYASSAFAPEAVVTINTVAWTVLRRQDEDF